MARGKSLDLDMVTDNDNMNIPSTKEDEKMIDSKRKVSFKLPLLLTLIILLTGCSRFINLNKKDSASEFTVPSYSTIDEYLSWAEKNDVNIRLIDSEGVIVGIEDKGTILQITSESILAGETLDIVVCRNGATCKLVIENDPMKKFNRQ
ncbi:MAG: hypothetical protein J6D33_07910 [Turicibacter sp.]|nr:hypothetical protein [Turicibacter sp.]